MRNTQLGTQIKTVPACVPTAGAVAGLTAVAVDGTGFGRCQFVLATGAIAATGTLDLKITQSATSGGSYTDITSAALVQVLTGGANKIYVIDVPVLAAKPFMKISGTVGTDTAANSIVAILYRGVNTPVDTAYATQYIVV